MEKQKIEPYSLEWYKEMRKLNKDTIISLVESKGKKVHSLQQQLEQSEKDLFNVKIESSHEIADLTKQVDVEIEAVHKLLNAFGQFCTLNGIKLTDSNKVGQAVIDFLKSDIYEIFKNQK